MERLGWRGLLRLRQSCKEIPRYAVKDVAMTNITRTQRKVSNLGQLSEAEFQVLSELDSGEVTILGDGKLPTESDHEARTVRASLLRILALQDDEKYRLHEKGIQIKGARISGILDLQRCLDLRGLSLNCCWFEQAPILNSARLAHLYLVDSRLPGLSADRLDTQGGMFLNNCMATGQVRLHGARIGGSLDCEGARFRLENDQDYKPVPVISAEGLKVEGSVLLRNGHATGQVRFTGAEIGRDFSCTNARFHAEKNPEGMPLPALHADRLKAQGDVYLRDFQATGQVRFPGAKLQGSLDCEGATFLAEKAPDGTPLHALIADGIEVAGSVVLRNTTATGQVRFTAAKLGRDLTCNRAKFRAEECQDGLPRNALSADRLDVQGSVFLRDIESTGQLRFAGARLGGSLYCEGAQLRVKRCREGKLRDALNAKGLQVASLELKPVNVLGNIRVDTAVIRGNLNYQHAQRSAQDSMALDIRGSSVLGVLKLVAPEEPEEKPLESLLFSGAHTRALDVSEAVLACPERVWLNRFSYDGLVGKSVHIPVEKWLAFLSKQFLVDNPGDFYPQPYEKLARVLKEAGHSTDSRTVLIRKEKLLRAARRSGSQGPQRAALWLRDTILNQSIKYGLQPLRAGLGLSLFLLLGSLLFFLAYSKGAMKPNNALVLRSQEWFACAYDRGKEVFDSSLGKTITGRRSGNQSQIDCFVDQPEARSYPKFNAFIYSADTLLPIVSMEMQEYWIPDDRKPYGKQIRWYLWGHIAIGWAFSLLAVAGFSGLVKSD